MKRVVRTFFFFSKRERVGVVILFSILLACLLAPRVYTFFKIETDSDFSSFDQAIALLKSRIDSEKNNTNTKSKHQTEIPKEETRLFTFDPNSISKDSMLLLGISSKLAQTIVNYRNKGGKFFKPEGFKKMYGLSEDQYQQLRPYIHVTAFGKNKPVFAKSNVKEEKIAVNLIPFDPNTATSAELQALGLSKKVSSTLVKFRSKGGQFFKKEDLKKIYGISESQYELLEPFINIPQKEIAENNTPTTYNNSTKRVDNPTVNLKKSIQIDINKASPEEWQNLYGIGPSYAKRITNYRNKLGGFSNVGQVAETYGIPDSTFQKIKPSLIASPIVRKIPLNSCDAKTLSNHPYIRYQLANNIIAYRGQHGSFQKLEDLLEIGSLDKATFEKIRPYLFIE